MFRCGPQPRRPRCCGPPWILVLDWVPGLVGYSGILAAFFFELGYGLFSHSAFLVPRMGIRQGSLGAASWAGGLWVTVGRLGRAGQVWGVEGRLGRQAVPAVPGPPAQPGAWRARPSCGRELPSGERVLPQGRGSRGHAAASSQTEPQAVRARLPLTGALPAGGRLEGAEARAQQAARVPALQSARLHVPLQRRPAVVRPLLHGNAAPHASLPWPRGPGRCCGTHEGAVPLRGRPLSAGRASGPPSSLPCSGLGNWRPPRRAGTRPPSVPSRLLSPLFLAGVPGTRTSHLLSVLGLWCGHPPTCLRRQTLG